MNHPYDVGHQKLEHQLIILDPENTGKNHLDEVQAGPGAVTHQEIDACSKCLLFCYTVLYG